MICHKTSPKGFRSGFVLIETLQGLILCAFALSLCFALAPFMSHKFAITQANLTSGRAYPQVLNAPPSNLKLHSANKTFVFSKHTLSRQDLALPISLTYLHITSVR